MAHTSSSAATTHNVTILCRYPAAAACSRRLGGVHRLGPGGLPAARHSRGGGWPGAHADGHHGGAAGHQCGKLWARVPAPAEAAHADGDGGCVQGHDTGVVKVTVPRMLKVAGQ